MPKLVRALRITILVFVLVVGAGCVFVIGGALAHPQACRTQLLHEPLPAWAPCKIAWGGPGDAQ